MNDQDKQRRAHLQHEAEHAKPHKKVSVMSYLAILFAAAFLLLLLSYFMQQRSNEAAFSGLKDSSQSALQSVQNLLSENDELHDRVDQMDQQLEQAQKELEQAQAEAKAAQAAQNEQRFQLQAMDWFWRIQRAYSRSSRSEARELTDQFEQSGLPKYLPNESLSGVDAPSPAEQYKALLEAMGYRTATTP